MNFQNIKKFATPCRVSPTSSFRLLGEKVMYMEVISSFEFDFYEFTKTCICYYCRVLKGISFVLVSAPNMMSVWEGRCARGGWVSSNKAGNYSNGVSRNENLAHTQYLIIITLCMKSHSHPRRRGGDGVKSERWKGKTVSEV